MSQTLLHELVEPFQRFRHSEPLWFWFEELERWQLFRGWQIVRAEVLRTGDIERLHSSREEYHTYLLGLLKLVDAYTTLFSVAGDEFGPPRGLLINRLEKARQALQQHYDSLFPKWQTCEDLEDILLAPLTPSAEVREELANRFPPPQSWFDETVDPTTDAEATT